MNTINSAIQNNENPGEHKGVSVSQPLKGNSLSIGGGFEAKSFRAQDVGEAMDPLVMVDHYVMTASTFGAHPHAGMSAVSLLFDDTEGLFHNRDSLGNDFDLQPGDLYWLKAGSGAVHNEYPRPGARAHGLQVFINLPESRRYDSPKSLLVRSNDMPVIETEDYRVKVALGESNGRSGAVSPALSMNILDGTIHPGGQFSHGSTANSGIWVQAVSGDLQISIGEEVRFIESGQAIAIRNDNGSEIRLSNTSHNASHFALFDGEQVNETYIQEGPFVMGSRDQIAGIKAAYEAGELGSV